MKVQRCKSERSSCAKVQRCDEITEYRLRSTEGWQGDGRCAANGRDAVAPLPKGRVKGGTGDREVGRRAEPAA